MEISKLLYIVDTNYRPDILVKCDPEWQEELFDEREEFFAKVKKALPKEAQHSPILTIEMYQGERRYRYFRLEYSLPATKFNSQNLDGVAQELDMLVRGEHEKIIRALRGSSIGFLVNHAGEHYDPVFEILQRQFSYKLIRVPVLKEGVLEERVQ